MQVDLYNGRKMVVIVLMSKGFKRHFGLVGVCANNFVNLPVFLFTYLFQAARPIYRTVKYNKSCTHAHTHIMHKKNLKESNTHTHTHTPV